MRSTTLVGGFRAAAATGVECCLLALVANVAAAVDSHEDVLAAGLSQTAATVHWVDEGIDTGPVIRTEPVPVEPGDTPATLRARVQRVEHRILPEVVKELIAA